MPDKEMVARFAQTAIANVAMEYPYKLEQVLGSDADIAAPRTLHPAFFGSYDWHSCVHMHWTLAALLRLHPNHSLAAATRVHFDQRLNDGTIAGELATLQQPHRTSFERPYGWGWLLKLATELTSLANINTAAIRWRNAVAPLADAFADRFLDHLPRVVYPTRAGTHGNTAFALLLALDYCEALQHRALHRAISERANLWFGRDRRYPASYEPSGEDFLSGGLTEAALMARVIEGCSFADWWAEFQPTRDAMHAWLQPVSVTDASDPKIVHLHGLNLSRAWCWQQLLPELDKDLQTIVTVAIERHLAASLAVATHGDYVATHWLVSFALLALMERSESTS